MLDRIASFSLLVMSRLPCRSWCAPSRAENCPWHALYIGAVHVILLAMHSRAANDSSRDDGA